MCRLLIVLFTFVCTLASAQSNFSLDTLWIHKADPQEEDIDSYFPIVTSSTRPAVARNVNTALQMQAMGYLLTPEKKTALLHQDPNPFQRTNLSFGFKRMTDRFFYIDVLTWHFNNTMSLNGWNKVSRFYFDAGNGHPVSLNEVLFTSQTISRQAGVIGSGLQENMVNVMKKYDSDFRLEGMAALDHDCQCNCGMLLKNSYRDNKVRFDYNEGLKTFRFSMDDCDWSNPRAHDVYETELRKEETDPWLTPYGRYLIYGGPAAVNESYFKMWNGLIDGKIPITFFLWVDNVAEHGGHGVEIYDRHGVSIQLYTKVTSDNSLEMHELDQGGKAVAKIIAKWQGSNLVGQWTKADGSKTLSFTASPAK